MTSITFSESNQKTHIPWGEVEQDDSSDTEIPVSEINLNDRKYHFSFAQSQAAVEDEVATVRRIVEEFDQRFKHLEQRFTQVVEMLTSVIANQQSNGKAVGYDWGIENNPAIVDALNWIVEKIREAGSNSILPSQLGLLWNNEFKNTPGPWVSEKKPDGKKIGIKAFVTKYGKGILFVEDTDHVKAKILFNP